MDEKDSKQALNDLGARLNTARLAHQGPASKKPALRGEASGFGQAMRVGAELISGLVVGVGLGWLLDDWLDTKPLMMIIFIFLGGAAGMLNVFRTSMRMAEDAKNGPHAGPETEPLDALDHDAKADGREK